MDLEGDGIEVEDIPPMKEEEEAAPRKLSKKERMRLRRAMRKKTLKRKQQRKKEKREAEKRQEAGSDAEQPSERQSLAQSALEYLRLWREDRSSWKFNKRYQTWLLRNMCASDLVPHDDFKIMRRYVRGLVGTAKATTLEGIEQLLRHGGANVNRKRLCRMQKILSEEPSDGSE